MAGKFPRLPAAPLAAALERIEHKHSLAEVFRAAGSSDRTYRDWRKGARTEAEFNKADGLLVRFGLLWHDVWNEDSTRRYLLTVTTYGQRQNANGRGAGRMRLATRWYCDLGPDYEALELVEYAFTGERPDANEQLEMAA